MTVSELVEALGSTADLRDESPEVRASLSALGRLLGASLAEPRRDLRSFAEDHLRVPAAAIAAVTAPLPGLHAPLVRVEVGRLIRDVPGSVLADELGLDAPGYGLVTVGVDEHLAAPDDLAAYLPAGTVFEFDTVLVLTWQRGGRLIVLRIREDDTDAARAALSALVARALGPSNFYRGRTVRAEADDRYLSLTPVPAATTTRADLVHADRVWDEIEANVGGLVRNGAALVAAGLGASRGLLLVGAPGVGKTALCRVIASELPASTTVLLVAPDVTPGGLARVYDAANDLAPAMVVLDDIDLITGSRTNGGGGPELGEFLTKLDGFTPSAAVLTVATTNSVAALDPALIRSGRFDSVIEVGPPGLDGRVAILRRYVASVAPDVDVRAVAARCDGATGADLREVVRRAVLERGTEVTTEVLLDVVASGRWRAMAPTGQYL